MSDRMDDVTGDDARPEFREGTMDRLDGVDVRDQRVVSEGTPDADLVETTIDEPRPDFARGQETDVHDPDGADTPDFARGQRDLTLTGDDPALAREQLHEGEFAEGQEVLEHHPEDKLHGRFSRGQSADVEAPDGVIGDVADEDDETEGLVVEEEVVVVQVDDDEVSTP